MDLKLNIYKGKEIEKTYEARDVELETGTCEDVLALVDIDKLTNIDEKSLAVEVLKIVTKALPTFKLVLKQVFDGLTDEELRRTKIKEVGKVIVNIVLFTLADLASFNNSKN